MKVIALYARVSSDKQVQESTILSQIEALENRIKTDGFKLIDEFKFIDNGYSGSNLIRPGLEKLRDKISIGAIDKIYIHSPDRLSRKYAYQMLLLEEFQRAGVEVVFLNHQINDNPESHLLLQMQGMIAEYERAKIMERSRRGKIHSAKMGNVSILVKAPYGYRYINKQTNAGQAAFEINIEEAEIIKKIFFWSGKDRCSMMEISRKLQNMNIRSPKGDIYWHRSTIWYILKNPIYIGQAVYGRTKTIAKITPIRPPKGSKEHSNRNYSIKRTAKENWIYMPVPAIIDEDIFNIVQQQLEENKKMARASKRGAAYLLQGLIVCQCCQYAYHGITRKSDKLKTVNHSYYRCGGRNANYLGGNKICSNRQIRADILDIMVWEEVKHLLKNPHRILDEYQRRISDVEKLPLNFANDFIEKQVYKLRQGIERLIDSYTKQYIEQVEFEPRIKSMRERLKILEERKKDIADQKNLKEDLKLIITNLEEFTASIEKNLNFTDQDWNAKRDIIRMLVKRIEIHQEDIKIVFKINDVPKLNYNNNLSGNNEILQHCRMNP